MASNPVYEVLPKKCSFCKKKNCFRYRIYPLRPDLVQMYYACGLSKLHDDDAHTTLYLGLYKPLIYDGEVIL